MLEILKQNKFNFRAYKQKRSIDYPKFEAEVRRIIEAVKIKKDKAVYSFASEFDNTDLRKIGIKERQENFEKAYKRYLKKDKKFIIAIKKSIDRVREFHQSQKEKSFFLTENKDGIAIKGQMVIPIDRVAIYIPGGKAVYPSTLIMNVVPAQIAGVNNVYVTTPVKNNQPMSDEILVTMYLLGEKNLFKIGGAHSIAAFTYGTQTIPAVDKIVGPGNIYVAIAKKMVYGEVDIDMIAGPTEVLIISDGKVKPEYAAIDLLAQAEHDEMATPILITTSEKFAKDVDNVLKKILKKYKSRIAEQSIKKNGFAVIVKKLEDAFNISNKIAPEHLEIMLENPFEYLPMVKNAGSIFLGEYSPESVGDYIAGPNHTLPTMGTARFYSQLGVYHFVKRTGITYFSNKRLNDLSQYVSKIAEKEKLKFHALSVKREKFKL